MCIVLKYKAPIPNEITETMTPRRKEPDHEHITLALPRRRWNCGCCPSGCDRSGLMRPQLTSAAHTHTRHKTME